MRLTTAYRTQIFLWNTHLIGNYPHYVGSEGKLRLQDLSTELPRKILIHSSSSNPHLPSVYHMVRFLHSFKF